MKLFFRNSCLTTTLMTTTMVTLILTRLTILECTNSRFVSVLVAVAMTGLTAPSLIPAKRPAGEIPGGSITPGRFVLSLGEEAVAAEITVSTLMAFLSAGFILLGIGPRHAKTGRIVGGKSVFLRTRHVSYAFCRLLIIIIIIPTKTLTLHRLRWILKRTISTEMLWIIAACTVNPWRPLRLRPPLRPRLWWGCPICPRLCHLHIHLPHHFLRWKQPPVDFHRFRGTKSIIITSTIWD